MAKAKSKTSHFVIKLPVAGGVISATLDIEEFAVYVRPSVVTTGRTLVLWREVLPGSWVRFTNRPTSRTVEWSTLGTPPKGSTIVDVNKVVANVLSRALRGLE